MKPQGYLGRLIATASSYTAGPPEGMPQPLLWGETEVVRDRLKDLAGSVDIQPRSVTLRFGSVQAVLDFPSATTARSSSSTRSCRPSATRR